MYFLCGMDARLLLEIDGRVDVRLVENLLFSMEDWELDMVVAAAKREQVMRMAEARGQERRWIGPEIVEEPGMVTAPAKQGSALYTTASPGIVPEDAAAPGAGAPAEQRRSVQRTAMPGIVAAAGRYGVVSQGISNMISRVLSRCSRRGGKTA